MNKDNTEKEYAWFANDEFPFNETFKSEREAIADAKYHKELEDGVFDRDLYYEDDLVPYIVTIGEVKRFDINKVAEKSIDFVKEYLDNEIDEFASGYDGETEIKISDKEEFAKEFTALIKKHFYFFPNMTAIPMYDYNLLTDKVEEDE